MMKQEHLGLCRAAALLTVAFALLALAGFSPALASPGVSPLVLKVFPENGAIDADLDAKIMATFNEEIRKDSLNGFTFMISDSTSQVAGSIFYDDGSRTVEFRPHSPLAPNTTYKAMVHRSVTGINGLAMESDRSWIFTTRSIDVIRPLILSASPGPGAVNVEARPEIRAVFSEELRESTLNAANIRLTNVHGAAVTLDIGYDRSNNSVIVKPTWDLAHLENYTVSFGRGIQDLAGNAMARDVEWTLGVRAKPDEAAPKVLSTVPWNEAKRIPLDSPVEITFSEPLDEREINAFNIHFRDSKGRDVAGLVHYDGKASMIRFSPAYPLNYSTGYKVTVDRSVKDLSGNNLAEDFNFSFWTVDPPDGEAPRILSTYPADREKDIPLEARIQVAFSEPIKEITINEFTVFLSDGQYRVPGAISYDKENKTLTFRPEKALSFGVDYVMTVKKGVKDLAGNDLKDGVIFAFRTLPVPDKVPPRLIFSAPAVGEAGVAVNSRLEVFFDESLDPASVNVFSVSVEAEGGKKVHGKASYVDNAKKIAFIPSAPLSHDSVYTVRISKIKDAAGNMMLGVETWTFKTASAPDTKGPEVLSVRPETDSAGVDPLTKISVVFSEPVNSLTVNEFTFFISDGANRIKSEIKAEPGANTAVLDPMYPLDYDKMYWVHVKAGVCDVAGNRMEKDFEWKFSTIEPPDLIPPRVASVWPKDGQDEVDVNSNVVVTFSEPVRELSVDRHSVQLFLNGRRLDGSVTYDKERRKASFAPAERLAFGLKYTLVVNPGIQDLSGNNLEGPHRSVFTAITRQKVAGLDLEQGYTYFETNPFPDLNRDHWAANAVRELVRKGYVTGYSQNLFKGEGTASRYEVALILKKIIDNITVRRKLDKYDGLLVEKLVTEFSRELNVLGARIDDFGRTLRQIGIDVKDARIEVTRMKEQVGELKARTKLQKQIEKYRRMAAMTLIMMM